MKFKIRHSTVLTAFLLASFCSTNPAKAEVIRDDNSQLAQRCHVPAYVWQDNKAAPKEVVVIVHAFTLYGRSAEELAKRLAQDNYLVVSLDQRGHGRWCTPGQPGPRSAVDYKASSSDLLRVLAEVKEEHPDLGVYCIGESSGAAIVAKAARVPNSKIDGIVLCSPGSRPRIFNVFWVVSDFLCNIYRLNHPIDVRKYITSYASNEPRVVQEMLNQPLDRNDLTGHDLFRTLAFIKHTNANLKHLPGDMPLLIVQGKKDHIQQILSVRSMFHTAKTQDKSLLMFPSYGHVLIGTAYVHDDVAQAITNWLDTRCPDKRQSASAGDVMPAK